MHRLILPIALVALSGCNLVATEGPAGETGLQGPPGQQGAHGINGEDGVDAAQDGSRLAARWIVGADGSKQFHGDFLDTERGEVCVYREEGDELRCLPPVLDSTAWNTYVSPDCAGDYGFVALYEPAGSEGSSLVRIHGGPLDEQILMRGEEVPALYTNGSGLPCQPLLPTDGFPPPYYHWPVFDPSAFVLGTVE